MKSYGAEDKLLDGVHWVQDAGACSGVYALENGRTLIDAGNMYGLIDELQDLGPLDKLERLLLTHSHFDHVGGMEEIYQVVSPDLYVHPMSREYLNLLRPPFPAFFEALEKDGKIKLIKDGDLLEGSPSLRVIHTPGHTAGDVCFFDELSGSLFSGDAILPHRYDLAAVISKPDEVCGGRMQDKVGSLRKLLALPVRHLFPGHAEPVLHRGADQIKITLYSLYQSLNAEHPENAWLSIGEDLLELGKIEEARQCGAKASQLEPGSAAVREFNEKVEASLD